MEADFLRFYSIEDYTQIDAARFFRLAVRLFAYEGVMAARLAKQQEDNNSGHQTVRPKTPQEEKFELRKRGAEVVKAPTKEKSYLLDRLKEG